MILLSVSASLSGLSEMLHQRMPAQVLGANCSTQKRSAGEMRLNEENAWVGLACTTSSSGRLGHDCRQAWLNLNQTQSTSMLCRQCSAA